MDMQSAAINGYVRQATTNRSRHAHMVTVIGALSVLVMLVVFYQLRLTGLTLAGDADCGMAEHVHSDACVEQTLVCDEDEGDGHVHTGACYEASYTCGFAADYNHEHTIDCYSDDTADVETAAEWEVTLEPALSQLGDGWADNVVALAQTQLGYAESATNWELDDAGQRQGYTRYGAWYGSPYVEWDSVFASFVLSYAGVGEDVAPFGSGAHSWAVALDEDGLYAQAADHDPQAGDVAFIDTDGDGQANRAGIVEAVAEDGAVTTIEGDVDGVVAEVAYPADATVAGRTDETGEPLATVLGYLPTSEAQAAYEEYQQEQAAEEDSEDSADDPDDGVMVAAETTANYVGFAEYNFSAGDERYIYVQRNEDGHINSGAYYMIDRSTYDSVMADSTLTNEQKQTQLLASAEVAYCYNKSLAQPTTELGGDSTENSYSKDTVSSSLSTSSASNRKTTYSSNYTADSYANNPAGTETLSEEDFYRKIIAIVNNGYPKNSSGLLTTLTNSIGDEEKAKRVLRGLTQHAIWFYTDNVYFKWDSSNSTYYKLYAGLFQNVNGTETALNSDGYTNYTDLFPRVTTTVNGTTYSSVEFEVYLALINSTITDEDAAALNIGMYSSTDTRSGKNMQNLLTVGLNNSGTDVSPDPGTDPDPTTETVSIQIKATKEFTGGMLYGGDFTFTLYDSDQTTVLGTATNDADGTITFNAITLDAVAGTHTFYIQETNGGDTSINYDTEMKAVTVTVAEGTVQTSVPTGAYTESDLGTGSTVTSGYVSGIGTYDFAVTGASTMGAFCINPKVSFFANQTYPVVINPTNDQLSEGTQRTSSQSPNSEIDDVAAEMREALYWFYETGSTTITSDPYGKMQNYLRWLSGTKDSTSFSDTDAEAMRQTIKTWIADGHNVPSNFKLVLFSVTGQQPLVLGIYDSTGDDGWSATQDNTPIFTNSVVELGDYSATIKAKKTLDGTVPTGKTFTFILKENDVEVDRQTSDASGNVTFTLNYTQTGTHTYTIEEYNDGQAGIVYATNEETVVVNVADGSNDELAAIESAIASGTTFSAKTTYGSRDSTIGGYAYTFTVTPSGGSATQAYKLSTTRSSPSTYGSSYSATVAPDTTALAGVTSASEGDLKKLLYYFSQNSLTEATKIGLMLTLSNPSWSYASNFSTQLNSILQGSTAPSGYTLVLYEPSNVSTYTPLIAGFALEGGTTVTYGGQTLTDTNLPVFNNTTVTYTLPETGGMGTHVLMAIGALLVLGSIVFLGFKVFRRHERRSG